MDRSAYPARRNDWTIEPFEDGYLLYSPASERIMELNASATIVWQLCDGSRTVDEIVRLIVEAYPEERDRIEREVPTTLTKLEEVGGIIS